MKVVKIFMPLLKKFLIFKTFKFHENSKIKISREFKVANCWKGRKLLLEMYLTEQKSCNLLPQIEK